MTLSRRAVRSSPIASARYLTAPGAALVSLILVLSSTVASPAFAASSRAVSVLIPCAGKGLKVTLTTNRTSYVPGQSVRMTSTIRNTSKSSCNLTLGPTSPSFDITNPSGVEVWNNCDTIDGVGACPMYLMLRHLAPGALYSRTYWWDQRTGSGLTRVPVGNYTLNVRYDVAGSLRTHRLVIAPTP